MVTGSTDSEYLENVSNVLECLAKANLKLNLAKCSFMSPSVKYF